MKKLPVDISSFRAMIEGDYLYIDKTKAIYDLIMRRRLYFLSRPRRFGKSLLISTLQELFEGNKKLFDTTWIAAHGDYDWKKHPVLKFDFSEFNSKAYGDFENYLVWILDYEARKHAIDLSWVAQSSGAKLRILIEQLSVNNPVVILIDEYDAPLLNNLKDEEIAKDIQQSMKYFFSVLKSLDASNYVRAIFITGITKFSKTSIFSGMNNLTDITLSPEAATLLGYSQQELHDNFKDNFISFAQKEHSSLAEIKTVIQAWYNGYRFSRENVGVYNPYSIVHCFDQERLGNFWFETGTPSFLVGLLKNQYRYLENIEKMSVSASFLGTFELSGELPLIPILFQTGYLTINDYDKKTDSYTLRYANIEVKESFKKYLALSLTYNAPQAVESALSQFKTALLHNDMKLFCTTLTSFLANIPYQIHLDKEAYYHSILHVVVDLLGFGAHSEVSSSNGILDMVIETATMIFIFEFKFQSTAKVALNQILEKRYYEKYVALKKPIQLIGLSFNTKNKKLVIDWQSENLE